MNNNFNLWFILAVAAISLLQWLARKAKEQQGKNENRRVRQRAEDEALRTGRDPAAQSTRPPPSSHDAQQARLRELAEMRRRQLEEMRRQQRDAAAKRKGVVVRSTPRTPGQMPASGSRLPSPGPMSSGTIVRPAPKPAPRTPAPQRQAPPRPAPSKQTRAKAAQAPKKPTPEDTLLRASIKATPEDPHLAIVDHSAATKPGAAIRGQAVDWRQAIVLGAVLGTPIGLRPPGDPAERGW